MKKFFAVLAIAGLMTACNNATEKSEVATEAPAPAATDSSATKPATDSTATPAADSTVVKADSAHANHAH